ncbi:hypothetical protein EI555_010755 [Monodon monoceros]|uniref:Solute carrier family 2, facilitated glucose transporter member 12 n=1 Tax=Monodon monoceros TaxID=40151 RepID=A0A4U1F1T5_MONMO|nr:hypothetical protein EI555_010755 [Monodon monoceros]
MGQKKPCGKSQWPSVNFQSETARNAQLFAFCNNVHILEAAFKQKVEVTQNKPFPASPALLFWKPIESGGAVIDQTRILGVLVPEPEEEQEQFNFIISLRNYHRIKRNTAGLTKQPDPEGCGMFTLLSSVTAAVSGFLVGYELGLISGALLQIRTLLALTCHEQEMVVSSLLIGALLASLIGGVLIDRCGRRAAIILSSCLLGLGSLVLIISLSYAALIAGRIAIGVSISLSSIATCVYIAEIAPQHKRGLLVSLNELMIVIGILFAYISNYAFANVSHGWKYMFGLVIPLGVLQAIAMYFLPPSPRFLVMKGHEEAASKVLGKLRAISDTTEELTVIKSSLKDEYQYSFGDLFRSKDNMRTRIMIGLTLVFFVQITGQPNILFYASTVLKSVGFQSNEAASLASTGVGVVKVLSTIPATLLVDHVGSKTLLCVGSSVMAASLVTMGIVNLNIHMNFTNICRNHSPINQSLDESVLYGPVPWLVLSEIFPGGIRGRAMALTSSMNWGINLLISLTFLTVTGYETLSKKVLNCKLGEIQKPKYYPPLDRFHKYQEVGVEEQIEIRAQVRITKDEVAKQFCISNSFLGAASSSVYQGCIFMGKAQYLRAERKQLPSEILANSDFCNIKEPGTCLSLKQ